MKLLAKSEVESLLTGDYKSLIANLEAANSHRNSNEITFSKNVFLPITDICRNICGYCTFRRDPDSKDATILMKPDSIMKQLKTADSFNCREALFAFGEQADSEAVVMNELEALGFNNIVDYLHHMCDEALKKTGLLPHSNPGVLSKGELKQLREVNASMGLMLETTSQKLMNTVVHEQSPGKQPKLRIKSIENAGKLKIPFTTGLLIGIGETIEDRAESLLELRRLQNKYGHIQEIIIQNFKPKHGIPMENHGEPTLIEMIKMVTVTKLMFPDVSVQVPPNLNNQHSPIFLIAGADDWGGVSPVTPDFVNPEAPWPEVDELKKLTEELGFKLKERLPVYPDYINEEFLDSRILKKIEGMGHS
ncbi:FO synthase subunit 1 [Methanobacterium lacus]|uniref:7,8-didemethyl-8-hydroxy-5-deazariboflavin synthase n=1 Tax=Methanobacterium lacus (strain AL-21) TaxID=877455 RepID=F0T8N7_METLA|nr:7,8-didemethyl-8-hydroxy-5-deazariboflavin synthase subunit CofG [Methanobacterium lacus]ADZ08579.1 FO synthase subunit 1 [Methanobacterium lacus]